MSSVALKKAHCLWDLNVDFLCDLNVQFLWAINVDLNTMNAEGLGTLECL